MRSFWKLRPRVTSYSMLVISCQWLTTEVTLGLPADRNQVSCQIYAGWTDVLCAFFFSFFFLTLLKCYSRQTLSAESRGAIGCISQPEGSRCAMIIHQYFLTICWLNTANRCISRARIIVFLLILPVCFSLFLFFFCFFWIWYLMSFFALLLPFL